MSPAHCEQANYMQEASANGMLSGMVIEFWFLLRADFRRKGENNYCNVSSGAWYGLRNGQQISTY